ncbi:hypothetical protein PGAG_00164 [Phaeocystis globosa virus 12T]|uniref:Uncharacterized protein n=1 Tax=Phaeocystis globosa virus PgV-16T TaxID=3071227 RepID=A0AC59EX51_9VIRU|nr:hypothetical protein PGCG_00205 [Phaeocystis globosa virus]AET73053.1 hypothetical protein PGAG_00164 [Phaeocystis globosa virus 12T]AET73876.1 hypothetical protein PGBG_00168 [Phaeocystis globosa virus 14T]AGM15516.1 hypothetical protein PGCG_00205 [Phaeocystis globosa virus PgV-16T]UYE94246.1 hypothetical protein PGV14T_00205 [Phaeocystis globosa virus]
MSLVLDRLESKNSNIDTPLKKKPTKFTAEVLNVDAHQSNLMKENYQNLMNNSNYDLLGNGFESVNDNMDYVGSLTSNGTKLASKTKEINDSMPNKEAELVNEKKINRNFTLMKSIDVIISIIYLAVLITFLLGSVINREPNNIVNALVLTLIYVFYKILVRYVN